MGSVSQHLRVDPVLGEISTPRCLQRTLRSKGRVIKTVSKIADCNKISLDNDNEQRMLAVSLCGVC